MSKHDRFHLTMEMAKWFPRSQSSRLWSLGSAPAMPLPHQDTWRRPSEAATSRRMASLQSGHHRPSSETVAWSGHHPDSGVVRTSSTEQWDSGVLDCVLVSLKAAAILSTDCNRWRLDCQTFVFETVSVSNGRSHTGNLRFHVQLFKLVFCIEAVCFVEMFTVYVK